MEILPIIKKVSLHIFIYILIFSFVGWGIAQWILTPKDKQRVDIVKIEKETLSFYDLQAEIGKLSSSIPLFKTDGLENDDVYTQATALKKKWIDHTLFSKFAVEKDLVFTDDIFVSQLREIDLFHKDGLFSLESLNTMLPFTGFNNRTLRTEMEMQYLSTTIKDTILTEEPSSNLARAIHKSRNQTKIADIAVVSVDDIKIDDLPTEKELKQVYNRSKSILFNNLESKIFEIITVDISNGKERTREIAYDIEEMLITSDNSMSIVAKKFGAKYNKSDKIIKSQLQMLGTDDEKILKQIWELGLNIESEPIEVENSFIIVKAVEHISAHKKSFEESREDLVSEWRYNEQKKRAYLKANKILKNAKAGKWNDNKITTDTKIHSRKPFARGKDYTTEHEYVFKTKVNESRLFTTRSVADNETVVAYVIVNNVENVSENQFKMTDSLRQESIEVMNKFLVDSYSLWLSKKYKLEQNMMAFDNLFSIDK